MLPVGYRDWASQSEELLKPFESDSCVSEAEQNTITVEKKDIGIPFHFKLPTCGREFFIQKPFPWIVEKSVLMMRARKRALTRRATTPPATGQRHVDVRMMMLGRGGVGKSALTVRYLCHRFLWEYDPTLEDTYIKDVAVDGKSYRLHILDTAGECHNVDGELRRERQIREAHCFLLVYSVVDRLSFRATQDLLSLVAKCQTGKQRASRLPLVLVGNKSDLAVTDTTPSRSRQPRQVTYHEGESLAEDYGVPFFETSAATDGSGVQRAFHAAIHLARDRHQTHKLLARKTSSMSTSVFDLRYIFKDKLNRIIHISV